MRIRVLTKKGLSFLKEGKQKELYFFIFEIYVSEFNWAYWDGYEELPIVQTSFAFTLYIRRQLTWPVDDKHLGRLF